MQGAGVSLQERSNGRVPLGDPGPVVQETGGLDKRRKVHFDGAEPHTLEPFQGNAEEPFIFLIAEESKLIAPRHADSNGAERSIDDVARKRIRRIEACRHVEYRGRILGGQGENGHAVQ